MEILIIIIIIIIIIKQENDYSDVRQLIAVARALYKIKLKTQMLIVQKDSQVKLESNSSVFKRRLNVVSDWTARSEDGREFQARAQPQETLGRQVLNDTAEVLLDGSPSLC